jgi:dTDP-4-amino-4,6-dideoxygalactose transaminase
MSGISLIDYNGKDRRNFHYIVVQIDPAASPLDRDELVEVLHAENVLARKYFWPGCHRMQPYRALFPNAHLMLPNTERLAGRMMVLPTGQSVSHQDIETVCEIIESALAEPDTVKSSLSRRSA